VVEEAAAAAIVIVTPEIVLHTKPEQLILTLELNRHYLGRSTLFSLSPRVPRAPRAMQSSLVK
jgi:hypothetical protein